MTNPSSTEDFPQLGRYQVINRIASGGMAEVFLARAVGAMGFQRLVALKLIHANFTRDQEFVKMFIDEARIAMHLHHRNIVQVFDLDQVQDTYFIAMEYVHGVTVYDLYERFADRNRWVDVPLALYIVAEVCKGLHFAHTRSGANGQPLGIVHRDVSPQNVLLSFEGEVKITDFGIATAAERLHQTAAGIVKGKYAYMAPERLEDRKVDGRVDVFAAGVLLYELLTGENPFAGPSAVETIEAVLGNEVEPPSAKGAATSPRLDEIALQALAKDPDERFASAQAFADALTEFAMNQTFARRDMASGDSALAATLAELFPERAGRPLGEGDPSSLALPGVPVPEPEPEPHQDVDAPTVLRMAPVVASDPLADTSSSERAVSSDSTVAVEPVGPAALHTPGYGLNDAPAGSPTDDDTYTTATHSAPDPAEPEDGDGFAATMLSMPTPDEEEGPTQFEKSSKGSPMPSVSAPGPEPRGNTTGPTISPARPRVMPAGPRVVREQVRDAVQVPNRIRAETLAGPGPQIGTPYVAPAAPPPGQDSNPYASLHGSAGLSSVDVGRRRNLNLLAMVLLVVAAVAVGAAVVTVTRGGSVPAEISIRSRPSGAQVMINGQLQKETTPLLARVSGERTVVIEISKDGYESIREDVTLRAGETIELNPRLTPLTGSIVVTPQPDDAEVMVNGSSRGRGKVMVKGLPLGQPVEVVVRASGYTEKSQAVTLTRDDPRVSLHMNLAKSRRR